MYLWELQQELLAARDVGVSTSTIQRSLLRRGYTLKTVRLCVLSNIVLSNAFVKPTRVPLEADPDAQEAFLQTVELLYPAETLVFVDESACNRFTTQRKSAWALVGDRARRHDYFVRGTRSVLFASA